MQSILIVDDIAENRYFLEVLLKGNGFEVRSASNGAEALESARMTPPDLVVSDILMPVMDGYALCRKWRADERLKQIPFIFYTATFTDQKDEALALSLGANRFVIKPLEPQALMEIIREVLTASRSGQLGAADLPRQEGEFLKEYNEALFRKLEKKWPTWNGHTRSFSKPWQSRSAWRSNSARCKRWRPSVVFPPGSPTILITF